MSVKKLDEIYLFHLEKAFKQFKKHKNAIFKKAKIDITSDQWILLKTISEYEGISQIDLAKKSFKEPASVTRILDLLEKKGWVIRKNTENNRRIYSLWTTKKGQGLIQKILPIAIDIRKQGLKGLSKKESILLSNLLDKVFENFRN